MKAGEAAKVEGTPLSSGEVQAREVKLGADNGGGNDDDGDDDNGGGDDGGNSGSGGGN